jgi:hypothetical protein
MAHNSLPIGVPLREVVLSYSTSVLKWELQLREPSDFQNAPNLQYLSKECHL